MRLAVDSNCRPFSFGMRTRFPLCGRYTCLMDFDEYQEQATKTATFEGKEKDYQLMYLALGVTGEAGEIAEKVKKLMRNDDGVISDEKRDELKKEIGDVLWYLSQLSRVLGFSISDAADANIEKLADRAARGVIKSSGDTR